MSGQSHAPMYLYAWGVPNGDTKMKTTKTQKVCATLAWLKDEGRTKGLPRIKTLAWSQLARIYDRQPVGSPIRRAIEREARWCGYTPRTILALHRRH